MTNSPAHEKEDPMVGKAGAKETGNPTQQTGAQQRPGASNSESKGAETPGGQEGVTQGAIDSANQAAEDLAGKSRKEVETGSAPQ